MPISLANTTTADAYPAPGAAGAQVRGNDIFASGYFVVANAAVDVRYLYGQQGEDKFSPEFYAAPGNYPIAGNEVNPLNGIQFRSAVAGVPAQVWGGFFYKYDPTLQLGSEFTSAVSSSGAISPGSSGVVLAKAVGNPLLTISNSAALTDVINQNITAGQLGTNGIIRGKIWGYLQQNTGGNQAIRFQLLYGGAILIDMASGLAIGGGAAGLSTWRVDFELANLDVSHQAAWMEPKLGSALTWTTTVGNNNNGGNVNVDGGFVSGNSVSNINSASAQLLQLKVALGVANPAFNINSFAWHLELL